jgi:hypothetical protein
MKQAIGITKAEGFVFSEAQLDDFAKFDKMSLSEKENTIAEFLRKHDQSKK